MDREERIFNHATIRKQVKLTHYLDQEGIGVAPEVVGQLEAFASLLHEWNQVHNLTGAKSIGKIYENIVDSLYPVTFINTPKRLLDVGTGAGFPGLVLAIVWSQSEVVLAEPLKKRVAFLKYVAMDLGLSNVRVEAKRVEQLSGLPFDLISSRAVTNTELLLRLTGALSDEKTAYLFYKGSRVFDEISDLQHQLKYAIVQKNQRNYLTLQKEPK